MSGRRVVITGLGLVTPLGLGAEEFWAGLIAGRSAVAQTSFVEGEEPRALAARVPDFNIRSYVADRSLIRMMERSDRFGLTAARLAADEAPCDEIAPERRGAYVATSKLMGPVEVLFDAMRVSRNEAGEMTSALLGKDGYGQIPPLTLLNGLPNGCLFATSVIHSTRGAGTNLLGSGEVSLLAVMTAYHALRRGDLDWALAGGHDSATDRWSYANFQRLGLLSRRSDDPARAVKPFDRRRDGFAVGEGAGMVALEPLEQAQARGRKIWAEIVGCASTSDAAGMVSPRADGSALAVAIRNAIEQAGLSPDDIDYVNAYGSATPAGDRTEIRALESVFGNSRRRPLVSGIKGAIGHLVAASGVVELGATLLALQHQTVPATLNLEEPEPECRFDCVPHEARPAEIATALTICRGIGGQNAVMVLRR